MTAVLLVMAVWAGLWEEKKAFIIMLAFVALGVAIGGCSWTFLGTGYQDIGNNPELLRNITATLVNVLARLC